MSVHYPGFDVYFHSLCSDPQYSASERLSTPLKHLCHLTAYITRQGSPIVILEPPNTLHFLLSANKLKMKPFRLFCLCNVLLNNRLFPIFVVIMLAIHYN